MLSYYITASANGVASSAVGAEDRGVAAEERKALAGAGSGLLVGAVKNVPGLVGSVHDITPKESGGNYGRVSMERDSRGIEDAYQLCQQAKRCRDRQTRTGMNQVHRGYRQPREHPQSSR